MCSVFIICNLLDKGCSRMVKHIFFTDKMDNINLSSRNDDQL